MSLRSLLGVACATLLLSIVGEARARESFTCSYFDRQSRDEVVTGPFDVRGGTLLGPPNEYVPGRQRYQIIQNDETAIVGIREDQRQASPEFQFVLINKRTGDTKMGNIKAPRDLDEILIGTCKSVK
jgi:hypothetical protein